MKSEIRIADNSKTINDFIKLPGSIHASHTNWLPPLYQDERAFFNPRKNRAFSYCDTILAVAYVSGRPRGRIMGIIHRDYNTLHQEKTARFGFFDCYEDFEVATELIEYIKVWAMQKGMQCLTGPYGFSDRDPQGFLIEGNNDVPLIDTNCNLPYMTDFLTRAGFEKLIDCLTYKFDIHLLFPEVYNRTRQRAESAHRYQLLEFKSKKELKPYILPVLQLTNETYSHLYGFYPLNETDMKDLANRYMPVLDPEFVKVVMFNNEVIAYVVGLQNMSAGLKRAKGRLFPLGWYHILKSIKKAEQLDLMLGAVKQEQQGLGLEIWMGMKLLESAKKKGIKTIETHLILETNLRMRAVLERLNIPIAKRFRVYTTFFNQTGQPENI
ncbi:MAG: hypothetical protein H6541_07775 [Lentimicrobiaceae bacterium]|nr:hypothetical protein [Lentimicrobiaceae bacterium]